MANHKQRPNHSEAGTQWPKLYQYNHIFNTVIEIIYVLGVVMN